MIQSFNLCFSSVRRWMDQEPQSAMPASTEHPRCRAAAGLPACPPHAGAAAAACCSAAPGLPLLDPPRAAAAWRLLAAALSHAATAGHCFEVIFKSGLCLTRRRPWRGRCACPRTGFWRGAYADLAASVRGKVAWLTCARHVRANTGGAEHVTPFPRNGADQRTAGEGADITRHGRWRGPLVLPQRVELLASFFLFVPGGPPAPGLAVAGVR